MTHHAATLALQAALQGTTPERLQAAERNRQRAEARAQRLRAPVIITREIHA